MLRVFKLAAFRERQKIHSRARKLHSEIDRILEAVATGNYLISEKANTQRVVITNHFAHGPKNFQGQADAILAHPAVAVVTVVERTQETGHRVGMRVMQLNAVKAGQARSASRGGKNVRQHPGQFAHMRQVGVGHMFAITEAQ